MSLAVLRRSYLSRLDGEKRENYQVVCKNGKNLMSGAYDTLEQVEERVNQNVDNGTKKLVLDRKIRK